MRANILSREIIGHNKWTKIVEEKLRFKNGIIGDNLIVERGVALMIIPIIEENGELYTYMVKQYRHPIGREVW